MALSWLVGNLAKLISSRYLDSAAFVKAKINNSGVLALGKSLQVQ
jgi:hypothetical protein